MRGNYDDIMDLPHHVSAVRRPMSMEERAAQFSPFAALTGYGDAIRETGRITGEKRELSEEEREILDRKQNRLLAVRGERPEITVTYFVPDGKKEGGSYVTETGRFGKIDRYGRYLQLDSGIRIPLDNIARLEGSLFEDREGEA